MAHARAELISPQKRVDLSWLSKTWVHQLQCPYVLPSMIIGYWLCGNVGGHSLRYHCFVWNRSTLSAIVGDFEVHHSLRGGARFDSAYSANAQGVSGTL